MPAPPPPPGTIEPPSAYQDFIIEFDEGAEGTGGRPKLTVKATTYDDAFDSIVQTTEISLDGSAWFSMVKHPSIAQYSYSFVLQPAGVQTYNIKIRENSGTIFDLGDYQSGGGCTDLAGDKVKYFIWPSTLLPAEGTDRPLFLQAGESGSFSFNEHSINGGSTWKAADANGATNWTAAELALGSQPYEIVFRTKGVTAINCDVTHDVNTTWVPEPNPNFAASISWTNPSTNGGSNGTATVLAVGGSGGYLFTWNDIGIGPASRTGLSAGTYQCTVKDTISLIEIVVKAILTDPAEAVATFPNTTVRTNPLNPIRFKEEAAGDDMPLENYNFCEQPTENMAKPFTPEIFNIQDQTILQFISDFAGNYIKKTNTDTGAEEVLSLTLAQDNLNNSSTYSSSLQNLFFEGNPALKLRNNQSSTNPYANPQVGDIVIISDQPQYDGEYAIIGITNDETEDSIWVEGTNFGNLPVTVELLTGLRFNVFELPITFLDWGVGTYKLDFISVNNLGDETTQLRSEYVAVKAATPNTLLLVYKNNDNAFGVIWATEIIMRKRHEGFFVKAVPTRDSTNFRNSNDSPAILNSYVRNKEEYRLFQLPWYAVQRLALIYSCDIFNLNGKNMFVEELPETEQTDSRYLLSRQTLIAEEVDWLENQNTHDIGDTSQDSIVIGSDDEEVIGV